MDGSGHPPAGHGARPGPAPKNNFRLRHPPDPDANKPEWLKALERFEIMLIKGLFILAGIAFVASIIISIVTWDITPFLGTVIPAVVVYVLCAGRLTERDWLILNWWKK